MIGGVIGGLGEFFGIDSTILRLVFVLSIFLGGWGFFFYIVALLLVPLESDQSGTSGKA